MSVREIHMASDEKLDPMIVTAKETAHLLDPPMPLFRCRVASDQLPYTRTEDAKMSFDVDDLWELAARMVRQNVALRAMVLLGE
jgi:hypothetical protein